MLLTKSDFKACFDCRTRLYYRKNSYPSISDDNEYLRLLADGGFMVEYLAKARFPGGIDLVDQRDAAAATRQTAELLARADATLFEAAFSHGRFHARTDILKKSGNTLALIEVKSSAIEDEEDDAASPFLTKKGTVQGRWRKYLLDVAFQVHVVRQANPGCVVRPMLCVVNKGAVATEAETLARFHLAKDRTNPRARPMVSYDGEPAALRDSQLLIIRDVTAEVELLLPEVVARAGELAALLGDNEVRRVQEPISEFYAECRKCEYRTEGARSGFAECWGDLAHVTPHILDLYRVSQIASGGIEDPVPALLRAHRASILDLPEASLGGGNSYTVRRQMQWRCLHDGAVEYLPAALREELGAHQQAPGWPLHFIDFEACDIALPHHAGLRPYERVAFQWSCHTVDQEGVLSHAEWLNEEREFPSFAFARSLRERLGEQGTVYVWSSYEQVTLRKVLEQIQAWLARDPARAC